MEASHRPQQAQHLPIGRKVQNETPGSIRASLIPGEWVSSIDLSDAYLYISLHPASRKYLRFIHSSQVFQFTSLPLFQPSHSPTNFYNDCKGNKANGPHKGSQTLLITGRLAHLGPVSGGGISEHLDHGGPNTHLRLDKMNQEKSELKPTQVFLFMDYEYHLDPALVKPMIDRWFKL